MQHPLWDLSMSQHSGTVSPLSEHPASPALLTNPGPHRHTCSTLHSSSSSHRQHTASPGLELLCTGLRQRAESHPSPLPHREETGETAAAHSLGRPAFAIPSHSQPAPSGRFGRFFALFATQVHLWDGTTATTGSGHTGFPSASCSGCLCQLHTACRRGHSHTRESRSSPLGLFVGCQHIRRDKQHEVTTTQAKHAQHRGLGSTGCGWHTRLRHW